MRVGIDISIVTQSFAQHNPHYINDYIHYDEDACKSSCNASYSYLRYLKQAIGHDTGRKSFGEQNVNNKPY